MDIVQVSQMFPQGRRLTDDEQVLMAFSGAVNQERKCYCGGDLLVREVEKTVSGRKVFWRCTRHGDVRPD